MDNENKSKVSKKQQACVNRYVAANYDRINVTFRKGEKEQIKIVADRAGKSVNTYIIDAVHGAIEHDTLSQSDDFDIMEIQKKILKAQTPEEIKSVTEGLNNETLRELIVLIVDRLTPDNIKINRLLNES